MDPQLRQLEQFIISYFFHQKNKDPGKGRSQDVSNINRKDPLLRNTMLHNHVPPEETGKHVSQLFTNEPRRAISNRKAAKDAQNFLRNEVHVPEDVLEVASFILV